MRTGCSGGADSVDRRVRRNKLRLQTFHQELDQLNDEYGTRIRSNTCGWDLLNDLVGTYYVSTSIQKVSVDDFRCGNFYRCPQCQQHVRQMTRLRADILKNCRTAWITINQQISQRAWDKETAVYELTHQSNSAEVDMKEIVVMVHLRKDHWGSDIPTITM